MDPSSGRRGGAWTTRSCAGHRKGCTRTAKGARGRRQDMPTWENQVGKK